MSADYVEHNRRAWDEATKKGLRFTHPASDEQFREPMKFLDSRGWLGPSVAGLRVLCLAAGGGKQGPLFAAAGAETTVVDLSAEMLALDRQVAAERHLNVRTVQTTMEDLSMFAEDAFDLVVQPVSTCYVQDVLRVYAQVARITRPGGYYISQHKQPAHLQMHHLPAEVGYLLNEPYYRTEPLPEVSGALHREAGTVEFLHRWEDLVGGLGRAGFYVEDLAEPFHADVTAEAGTFKHRSYYAAPYVRIKAVRRAQARADKIWLP